MKGHFRMPADFAERSGKIHEAFLLGEVRHGDLEYSRVLHELGPDTKGYLPYRKALEFAKRFPGLPIVLAHWGGGMFFYELMPSVAAELRHVAYDTAASPLLYPTERIFRVALEILAAGLALLGAVHLLRSTLRLRRRLVRQAEDLSQVRAQAEAWRQQARRHPADL